MPSIKPVPALIPWLTALTAAPMVLVVAAMAATLFGGVDRAITYDLLTWTVARGLAWVGCVVALIVAVLTLRDLGRHWIYAAIAIVLAGATLGVFLYQGLRLAEPTPRDISTHVAEPPAYRRLADLHPGVSAVTGPETCPAARSIPTQVLAQQAVSALVDAGFPVVRAATFEVEGVHEGAWFGFAYDAVIRIRPGRTDIRVAARDPRPDGGATCRLMGKIVAALEEEVR
ncbi:DUF1499 domain-containing protein [Brevundimonas sp. SL130]|uniref:DUF1499 domain-containing protein n=1 Tax=Brevundimonas sp. SL130 TaxID=2995143 RepID=UPI00226CB3CB|nr:DUF1499 domain-containing protein [Brevundimonas sp. SL130]WAC58447.1 DUF1499 domain-containing protein [Brevundimonas sp. SL130]